MFVKTMFGSCNPLDTRSSSIYLNPVRNIPDRVAEMFRKLDRLQYLQEHWDSYQAEKTAIDAIENARTFLLDNYLFSLPYYFLSPGVNGEVMIEFQQGERAAELYFLPDGGHELVLYERDDVVFEVTRIELSPLIGFFNE